MSSTKSIMIFTVDFPFGNSETTFLQEEIKVLATYFKKVYLVPFDDSGTNKTILPHNVEICTGVANKESHFVRGTSDYIFIFSLFMKELFRSKNKLLLKNARYHLSELLFYLDLAKSLKQYFEKTGLSEPPDIFYTYWFDTWTSALAIFKIKYKTSFKLVTRAHGFDLYPERNDKGYIFPRQLQLSAVDKIFPISHDGSAYLKAKYPDAADKITFSRLGIKLMNNEVIKKERVNELVLVSCSSLVKVKRVHKIVEILSYSRLPVRWIHFGAGILLESIVELSKNLPKTVIVEMRGNVANSEITRFYSENSVDWFINVSESEGIPVSIMEAISFGIPVIATNVGGVKEIVTPTTGILIDKNFDPLSAVSLIENKKYSESDRRMIVQFWREHFEAEKNFSEFSDKLLQTVADINH